VFGVVEGSERTAEGERKQMVSKLEQIVRLAVNFCFSVILLSFSDSKERKMREETPFFEQQTRAQQHPLFRLLRRLLLCGAMTTRAMSRKSS
jgi:hypothetical protein